MESKFVHLKLHTEYTLLEGVGKIEEYIQKAKKMNMNALSITDTSMFGVVEFYKKCYKNGIKPIIGLEVYLDGIVSEGEYSLTLLAKNNVGYKNLCKLSSLSYSRYSIRRHKVKYEELKQYSEGLIILSGGIYSESVQGLLNYKYPEVKRLILKLSEEFKENFYIEFPTSIGLNKMKKSLFDIINDTNIKYILSNDVYYPNNGEAILQKIMLSIKEGNRIDYNEVDIFYDDLYLKSESQIKDSLNEFDENFIFDGIKNTYDISNMCNVKLNFDEFKFPKYDLSNENVTEEEYLKTLVYDGINRKYKIDMYNISEDNNAEVIKRVNYELDIINKMGYNGYFIIVWDFIKYSKEHGVYVGPGRGSAAGSIVSYALNITEIDPLKYNLIFERFLNPERVSMPDIDIDFDQEQREMVIDYVLKKYGYEKVAHIITFGTLKARAAIRDVGRVLNINLKKVDTVAKLVPFMMDLEPALESVDRLKELYNTDQEVKTLIDYSLKIEGRVRHASIHAAGIVISKDVLDEEIPTYSDGKTKILSTQYQMKELEDLGMLKMDFLGLKNLTVLRKTIENIKTYQDKNIDLYDIKLNDTKTYELLTNADTLGVFQCESQGIRRLMKKMRIDTFEDLIALLALYRPGPLRSGMVDEFINNKNNKRKVKYIDNMLEEILSETYGMILYQEQVMKIANVMGNYTLGEADELRRAMGKKIPEIMEQNKNKFVTNAQSKGVSKNKAEEVYNLIDKFGGYGFNKSHSASYALVAYWTAYFKVNYTKEFFAAIMSTEMYNIDRLSLFINEARDKGIKILVPDVNQSNFEFTVENEGIRFGLVAIKGIGINTVNEIIKTRLEIKTNYPSYEEFVYKLKKEGLNKKQLESLIFSGALDSLNGNRREKYHSVDKIMDWCDKKFNVEEDIQMILFGGNKSQIIGDFYLDNLEELRKSVLLNKEKEYLGVYVSDHPLNDYKDIMDIIERSSILSIQSLEYEKNTSKFRIIGIIKNILNTTTRVKLEPMSKFDIEDYSSSINCICFPNDYIKYSHNIYEDNVVIIEGNILIEKNKKTFVVSQINNLIDVDENSRLNLYILVDEYTKEKMSEIKQLLLLNRGLNSVYMATNENNKKELIKLNDKYKVRMSLQFINKLIDLIGKSRVKIR